MHGAFYWKEPCIGMNFPQIFIKTWASNTSPQTVGISFRINDLCQKLSAICHLYRPTSHKFRISGVGLLTNGCFATSVENILSLSDIISD